MATLDELREHYDNSDMSESILRAERETEVPDEIMVSTSIRLPRSLMERVREHATEVGVPATTLMRQWIIDRLETSAEQAVIPVAEIERFIATYSYIAKDLPLVESAVKHTEKPVKGARKARATKDRAKAKSS